MHLEFAYLSGPRRGRTERHDGPTIRLGTAGSAEVRLPEGFGIHADHAVIECRGGHAYLLARGAVRLGGEPVREARLQNGDLVSIGDVEMRVLVHVHAADRAREYRAMIAAPRGLGVPAPGVSPWARGLIAAGVSGLLLTLCLAGAYVARTDPGADPHANIAQTVARERRLHDLKMRAQQRAYETKVSQLKHNLASIETRIASERQAVQRTVGQVERAVKAVESNVANRVTHEVKRSLDPELKAARRRTARAERLIADLGGSVCMIQGAYGFGRNEDGKFAFLREASARMLEGMNVEDDKVPLMLDGDGEIFRVEFTGTGFVVDNGIVLTNRHIAQPWWKNAAAQPLIQDGFQPRFLSLRAYFPGRKRAVEFQLEKTLHSPDSDLSALYFRPVGPQPKPLPLADESDLVPGRRVLLFGFPSGLDALLARSHDGFARQFDDSALADPKTVLDALADEGLVRPLPTQGFIGDVLRDKVVFDAATAVGGSGGPLLDLDGRVVAINYGILKAFSSANFGVPVRYARELLKRARAAR